MPIRAVIAFIALIAIIAGINFLSRAAVQRAAEGFVFFIIL